MAIESVNRVDLRRRISAALQDDIARGTVTGGGSTSISDNLNLINFADDSLIGGTVYANGGTGAGQERYVTDSQASGGTLNVAHTFSPTLSTDTTFEIHRKFTVEQYNDAIDQALRRSRWANLIPIRERYHLTGTGVVNPLFTDWNAAVTLPDGWTNNTSNLSGTITDGARYAGHKLQAYAMVWSNSASAQFAVFDTTTTATATHTGGGEWELLELDITVTDNDIAINFQNTASSISAVLREDGTVGPYRLRLVFLDATELVVDWVWLEKPGRMLDYAIQADDADGSDRRNDFSSIHAVYVSTGLPTTAGPIDEPKLRKIPWHDWSVNNGDRNGAQLTFKYPLPAPRLLEYHGMGAEITGGDDDDVLRVNAEVIELYACYRLMMTIDPQKAQGYRDEWNRIKAETVIRYPAFSQIVNEF